MATVSAEQTSASRTNEPKGERETAEHLSGARADFVAGLGRRRAELKHLFDTIERDPTSKRPRDEMRRKIHALGAAAKLLRFPKLAEELRALEDVLGRAAERGSVDPDDLARAKGLITDMTALAWGQPATVAPIRVIGAQGATLEGSLVEEAAQAPISVLCVGNDKLATSLSDDSPRRTEGRAFEVESTTDGNVALDVARVLAPDIVIVDADLLNAKALVSTLVTDPLTESIPVIVLMRVARTDEAGPFLALGVAKVLPKPVSPGELRRACASVMTSYVQREIRREPLGDITVDELGARLAEELRRGLCDAADPESRVRSVALGEGTEVLAALWGAVARIRDIVTIRTRGQTRFALGGPEGAVPLAPWLEETNERDTRRNVSKTSRADDERSLQEMKVLVVDDDAAVCWFLAGVLKTAGATVYEARDGQRALEIAKHVRPDIVISDILMPKLDGFGLSRALRHDIVLRDSPIVLLSWKEDLLQRVRELGADADGYLRKEASAGTIVQRVRELCRPRARIRERVRSRAEVRGRLDGLTTFTLMSQVCAAWRDATLTVRDASYLYEIDIRAHRPVRATRTATTGSFDRGPSVLAALLGVGDGRFAIAAPKHEDVAERQDLDGTLEEQLAPVIATARSAQALLTGDNLMRVSRVEIDEDALLSYFGATPEPAKSVMLKLAQGACPRDLVTTGRVSARMLEDVLLDVASHAAVVQVLDATGEDQLPGSIKEELALLRGERSASPVVKLPLITSPIALPLSEDRAPVQPIAMQLPTTADLLRNLKEPDPSVAPPPVAAPALVTSFVDAAGNQSLLGAPCASPEPQPKPAASESVPPTGSQSPSPSPASSLAAHAFSTEISTLERDSESPVPPSGPRATPAPIELTLSPMPAAADVESSERRNRGVLDEPLLREAHWPVAKQRDLTPTPSRMPPPPGLKPMLTLGSLHPPPVDELPKEETPKPKNTKRAPTPTPAPVKVKEREVEREPRVPLPSAYLPPMAPYKRDYKAFYWILFTLVGVGFALWARAAREASRPSEAALFAETDRAREASQAPGDTAPPNSEPSDGEGSDPTKSEPSLGRTADPQPEELPLRSTDKVKKGYGILEVVAGKSDTIFVDGKPVGSGPLANVQLKAKSDPYEVRIKTRGEERSRFVQVKEERLVRVRLAPPWQR
jgi:DNA-binding response OmpR family regulator